MGADDKATQALIIPAEVLVKPGEEAQFTVKLYNSRGQLLKTTAEPKFEVDANGAILPDELTRVLAISILQMAMDDKDAGTSASATPVTMTLTGRIFALPDMAASSTRSAAGTAAGGTGTSASGGTTATPPATSPATQPASEPANSVAPAGQTAAMPGESSVTRGGQLS